MFERGAAAFNLLSHVLHEPAHDLVGDDVLVMAVDVNSRLQFRVLVGDHRDQEGGSRQVLHCCRLGSPLSRRGTGLAQLYGDVINSQLAWDINGPVSQNQAFERIAPGSEAALWLPPAKTNRWKGWDA
ncbi:hypothetical protein [Streptomyces phaeochromogenes]|uniref:hypothetical protein n=1 Tax=Streptomyces phaeochromogenes TaxID=1923 RepID=UPI003718BF59